MQISSEVFGQKDGHDIERYTITNKDGNFIKVLTLVPLGNPLRSTVPR
ncbi:hypothetical protein [Secundilactobacillus paracollinoides]|nr:hypothetical protein [Secundilactobacillus paracollinoides]